MFTQKLSVCAIVPKIDDSADACAALALTLAVPSGGASEFHMIYPKNNARYLRQHSGWRPQRRTRSKFCSPACGSGSPTAPSPSLLMTSIVLWRSVVSVLGSVASSSSSTPPPRLRQRDPGSLASSVRLPAAQTAGINTSARFTLFHQHV